MEKTWIWWKILCFAAVFNILIWLAAILAHADTQEFSILHPLLSGLYVLVCAFRSFYPRIDLERYCLIDSPLSSIVLGRSLATIAEICFSIQCALLLHDLGVYLDSGLVIMTAYAIVPLIVIAQVCCWKAALTLNHFWHGVEEALWVVMIVLAAACLGYGYTQLEGWLAGLMLVGIASCIGAAYVMLAIDIPMYWKRFQDHLKNKQRFLSLSAGMEDAMKRRVATADWAIWRNEVMWISSYFTVGVWLSISMMFISF